MATLAGRPAIAQAPNPSNMENTQSLSSTEAIEAYDGDQLDIDNFDDSPANVALPQDIVDGYVYKPDAIPLSQYRRNSLVEDGFANFSNNAEITGNGSREKSYYAAIYSGSTNGVYFQVAATICDMMKRTYKRHRIHCVPLRSQGVGSNIRLMKEGRVQLALVQSNNNWEAFKDINPIPGAQSVMSLHDEMGLLVVRKDSGIHSVADLKGKRINIGPEGSATRELWLELLKQYGIAQDDLETVYNVAQDYNRLGICENYIDAYGLWIGHPASLIEESLDCDAEVVGMGGPLTQKLVEANNYFFNQVLPARTYAGQEADIESYGFKASLIAYEPADPYVVYWITRIIHENIEQLKAENPTFRSVNGDDLFKKGNFLTFHKGAACYWETDPHACDWQSHYQQPVAVNGSNQPAYRRTMQ
ncbi:TAXI family TRAP transporter solute-binding subunit [Thalassospira sp. CH_XMU1448-2]|uniref:TAXI family TRAP transporter solute-binding subunit n=1 Tax=Thalassospira sp. CH_XMU1448-2 TaxID=3107773 RepID=UPI00300B829F